MFLAWGIAAWFLPFSEGETFYTDPGYNVFYLAMGPLLIWTGWTWNPEIRQLWTAVYGVLFLVIAIAGWAVSGLDAANLGVTNLETADNIVHVLVGLTFLLVAFQARSDLVYGEPPGTAMNVV